MRNKQLKQEKRQGEKVIRLTLLLPQWVLLISLFVLVFPLKVESFSSLTLLISFFNPVPPNRFEDKKPMKIHEPYRNVFLDHPAELVTIGGLLSDPNQYHKKIVKVRGMVTQPELHVDESRLFIRFVFVLQDAEHMLVVFGQHDQTQGNIQIETYEKVEVIGVFWKERKANDHDFQNNLEAITVTRYPPVHPDAA